MGLTLKTRSRFCYYYDSINGFSHLARLLSRKDRHPASWEHRYITVSQLVKGFLTVRRRSLAEFLSHQRMTPVRLTPSVAMLRELLRRAWKTREMFFAAPPAWNRQKNLAVEVTPDLPR